MAFKVSASTILCYVTDRAGLSANAAGARSRQSGGESAATESPFAALLKTVGDAGAAGVDWIQIREKDLTARDCAALTRAASQVCSTTATKLLINDRLDVALAEHAAGVHLGGSSLPPSEVRRLLEAFGQDKSCDFLVGVSCHSLASVDAAARSGADYVVFGPVFSTPSKAAFGAPQGLLRLAEVCRAVSIPVLAIGGLTLENAAACADAGAAGIAAIRLFQEARDLSATVARLRSLH
jgi:thiamine-phosphate pyrophosphorylase